MPDDYASDDRWDADNSIWRFTSDDFVAIAYRVEELQSSAGFLAINATILIEQFKMTLKAASTFIMRQHTDNVECVINMTAFTIAREGDDRQDKTYIDHDNGVINTNAGSPVVATLSTPVNILEAVADKIPGKVNEATKIQDILTNTENPVTLPDNLASAADAIVAMTNGDNQFTANALTNAPTSTGGSGGTSSGGLTAGQNEALTAINQATIAHSYPLNEALEQGTTTIPISGAFADGYFTGHYIVITDGVDNVAQRFISEHTNVTMPPSPENPQGAPMTVLTLSAAVNAFDAGAQVHILVRTTAQDGANIQGLQDTVANVAAVTDSLTITDGRIEAIAAIVRDKTGYALTGAERNAIAVQVETGILDETDNQAVVQAFVNAIGNTNIEQEVLIEAMRSAIERQDGLLVEARDHARAANVQTQRVTS